MDAVISTALDVSTTKATSSVRPVLMVSLVLHTENVDVLCLRQLIQMSLDVMVLHFLTVDMSWMHAEFVMVGM